MDKMNIIEPRSLRSFEDAFIKTTRAFMNRQKIDKMKDNEISALRKIITAAVRYSVPHHAFLEKEWSFLGSGSYGVVMSYRHIAMKIQFPLKIISMLQIIRKDDTFSNKEILGGNAMIMRSMLCGILYELETRRRVERKRVVNATDNFSVPALYGSSIISVSVDEVKSVGAVKNIRVHNTEYVRSLLLSRNYEQLRDDTGVGNNTHRFLISVIASRKYETALFTFVKNSLQLISSKSDTDVIKTLPKDDIEAMDRVDRERLRQDVARVMEMTVLVAARAISVLGPRYHKDTGIVHHDLHLANFVVMRKDLQKPILYTDNWVDDIHVAIIDYGMSSEYAIREDEPSSFDVDTLVTHPIPEFTVIQGDMKKIYEPILHNMYTKRTDEKWELIGRDRLVPSDASSSFQHVQSLPDEFRRIPSVNPYEATIFAYTRIDDLLRYGYAYDLLFFLNELKTSMSEIKPLEAPRRVTAVFVDAEMKLFMDTFTKTIENSIAASVPVSVQFSHKWRKVVRPDDPLPLDMKDIRMFYMGQTSRILDPIPI